MNFLRLSCVDARDAVSTPRLVKDRILIRVESHFI